MFAVLVIVMAVVPFVLVGWLLYEGRMRGWREPDRIDRPFRRAARRRAWPYTICMVLGSALAFGLTELLSPPDWLGWSLTWAGLLGGYAAGVRLRRLLDDRAALP